MANGMRWSEAELAKHRGKGAAKMRKPNKMGNVVTVVAGHTFPSLKEANHWTYLNSLAATGKITKLRKQYPIGITVNGEHICTLVVDFRFTDEAGLVRYQDTKGRRAGVQYQIFKLKQKLALACNGITVEEV